MIDEKETYVDDLRIWAWYIAISLGSRSWRRNLPFSSVLHQICERTRLTLQKHFISRLL